MKTLFFKQTAMEKLFFAIVFCMIFISCSQTKQDGFSCDDAQSWNYSVTPGMEEWNQFQSNEEMVRACQIPEDLFFCLSTEELTELCLRYPLLTDIFAFNSLNDGLDRLFKDFNGIRELYKRSNISGSLIAGYINKLQLFPLLNDDNVSALEKGQFLISVYTLEALMSRSALNNNDNLKEVLKALVAGYEIECKYPDYLSGVVYNYFARANVIANMCEKCPDMRPLIGVGISQETADVINEFSYQLINPSE